MQPAILLVNRRARRASAPAWLDAVRAELATAFDVDVRHPRNVAEAHDMARAAAAAGAVIVVAGGDGTVSLVANAIAGAGARLALLPLGTANDLARELRVPTDITTAARRVVTGVTYPVDLVSVNGRRFVTVGGLGLVSRSTMLVAAVRAGPAAPLARLAGASIYRLAATTSMLDRRISGRMAVRVTDADGAEQGFECEAHGLFVTNHATCGGGLVIPTGARADDGLFELAIIPRTTRARLLVHFARLSAGMPLATGALHVIRARRALIETDREDTFVADGEQLATGTRFELESLPASIGIVR